MAEDSGLTEPSKSDSRAVKLFSENVYSPVIRTRYKRNCNVFIGPEDIILVSVMNFLVWLIKLHLEQ